MSIAERISSLKEGFPKSVTLVAVSKTHPIEAIQKAYEVGQRVFGENKVQEMVEKSEQLPTDIKWHLIGHLQTNKVKYIAPFVTLIHSIDSEKLLKEVNKRARQNDRIIDCLLQIHIAEEDTKFGLNASEVMDILASDKFMEFENVRIVGLMGMATFTDDEAQVRREFQQLKSLFDQLNNDFPSTENWQPTELSMGMSGDYELAIEQGSTMVRVGSKIFGARDYS